MQIFKYSPVKAMITSKVKNDNYQKKGVNNLSKLVFKIKFQKNKIKNGG